MMRIAIDASRSVNLRGGISVYLNKLIEGLLQIDQENEYFLFYSFLRDKKKYKTDAIEKLQGVHLNKKIFRLPGKLKDKIVKSKIPFPECFVGKKDLFFAPTVMEYGYHTKIPTIVMVYDLTYFLFPTHLNEKISKELQRRTQFACQHAKKILTISQHSKQDIVNILNVPEEKVEVTYLAADPIFKKINKKSEVRKKYSLPEKFFLMVGTISPRKNLEFVFRVFQALPQEIQNDYKLVVVGEKGWNYENIFKEAQPLLEKAQVLFLNFVPIEDLVQVYNYADLFLFPSLYEGFGIPIIEAMACGVPVVASNNSCMSEIMQSYGLCLPLEENRWVESIIELLSNAPQREKLSQDALEHAKNFTWQKTAFQTLSAFKK